MGKITVIIPDELEEKLRQGAVRRHGLRRGYLTKAVIEAIRKYLEEEAQTKEE